MNIFIGIIALSFLVIVHELGHFTVAKLSGIKVLEFALFMGPKIFSVKKGETVYSLRAIPLGGFVRMEGEEAESEDERSFNKKPLYIRAAVVFAGPLMNIVVAVILCFIIFAWSGYTTNYVSEVRQGSVAENSGLKSGDEILKYNRYNIVVPDFEIGLFSLAGNKDSVDLEVQRTENGKSVTRNLTIKKNEIAERTSYKIGVTFYPEMVDSEEKVVALQVVSNSPASKAGFKKGDQVLKVDGEKIQSRSQLTKAIEGSGGRQLTVSVLRDGAEVDLNVTPKELKEPAHYDENIGFSLQDKQGGVVETANQSFKSVYSSVRVVYYSLAFLIAGNVPADQMSGPVGIVTAIGDVVETSVDVKATVLKLLYITAMISINLAVMNLLPFPALDGSKLVLYAIQGIMKKTIPAEKEAIITLIGFSLLVLLLIFTTSNDIIRLLNNRW